MSRSRSGAERNIISKAMKDPGYRERLKSDPKGTIESEIGGRLPEGLNIHVNEEDAGNVHITLPHAGEMSSEELKGVSGGWDAIEATRGCGSDDFSTSNEYL